MFGCPKQTDDHVPVKRGNSEYVSGQEACGMFTHDGSGLFRTGRPGTADEVFIHETVIPPSMIGLLAKQPEKAVCFPLDFVLFRSTLSGKGSET